MPYLTSEQFIARAKQKHGDKFDYSLVEYQSALTKVVIICRKCNRKFEQKPTQHLLGRGCRLCAKDKANKFFETVWPDRKR